MPDLRLRKFTIFRQGEDTSFNLDQRLFNTLGFYAGILGIGAAAINLLIDARKDLIILAALFSIISFIVFYLSRFTKNVLIGKWVFTFIVFGISSYLFFINNGSRGPILYMYMTMYLFLLMIWDGRVQLFFLVLFFINITAFFVIELKYPDAVDPYRDEKSRLYDVYLSYYMFIFLIGSILTFMKKGYIREKKRAEKSDTLKSAFLANMSHEIRTPMNAILGFAQLLQEDVTKDKRDMYIQIIKDNSENLLRIIEDIIDISKIEAGELKISEETVNLKDLFAGLGSELHQNVHEYKEKQIEIIEDYPSEELLVVCDYTRLKQVLNNLISNAFKYTEKGSITIGYKREDGKLRFFVRDTGTGIRKENLEEIFERFRKVETEASRKIQPGTGIGLSISKNLVELMGGRIGVQSEYGIGSEFYFTLPYMAADTPVASKVVKEKTTDWTNVDLSGRNILVAEDDAINYDFLRKALEKRGATVYHAGDGEEVLNLMEKHREIDIVLMDIMMPVMDGYQATRIVKKKYPGIPVIAQTALAMEGDEVQIRNAGCDDYLSKPIAMSDLYKAIAHYLDLS